MVLPTLDGLPTGKLTVRYRKWPILFGDLRIKMAGFPVHKLLVCQRVIIIHTNTN